MTNETNKVALTATEQAQREAALAISKAADKAVDDSLDTGKALAAIAAAKTATVTTDTPKPSEATTTTPTAEKPAGEAGSKANPLPDLTATSVPTVKPVSAQGGSQGGKAGKAQSKPKVDTKAKADDKPADTVVEGFDFKNWPPYLASIKPPRWAIVAAATPLVGAKPVYKPGTSNHLALACYLYMGFIKTAPNDKVFNYFDVGEGIALTRNTQPDNKSNCANRWQSLGLGFIQKVSPVPYKNPNKTGQSGGKMAYGMTLYETDTGRPDGRVTKSVKPEVVKKIQAWLEASNCKPPAHFFGPLVKPVPDKPALPSK